MFWSKFIGTLRFRITVWYTFLFAVLLVPAFLLFHRMLEHEMLMLTDFTLAGTIRQLRFEYLTGNKVSRSEQEIPLEMLPPDLLPTLTEKFPDFIPMLAFQTPARGMQYYTVIGSRDSNYFEMRPSAALDGEFYSRRLNPSGNIKLLQRAFEARQAHDVYESVFYRLLAPNGRILAGTPIQYFEALPPAASAEPGAFQYFTVSTQDNLYRILRTKLYDGNVLEIGRSLRPLEQKLEKYLSFSILWALVFLLAGGVAAYLLSGKFVSGIKRTTLAAQKIAGGDFSGRVPIENDGSEINDMIRTFNHMSENTEHLVEDLKNVTDNIAHDLRTPLTRIRGISEVTVNGPQDLNLYRDMAGTVSEECSNMVRMINTMLEITRTEAGRERLEKTPFDLKELFERAVELFLPLVEEKKIRMELHALNLPVSVCCDKLKIQRAVGNLLDNAIKFSPEYTTIRIHLVLDGAFISVTISDQGCGISQEDQKQLFKRFFRSDSSRTLPGNGLGLSLVHAIILAHGGTIKVTSSPGKGTDIRFTLPRYTGKTV